MNRFEEDLLQSDRVQDVVHKDAFRFHFRPWIEVQGVSSANHKVSVTHAMVTGAGVSVTSGSASTNVAGIDTVTQRIDFLQLEHQLRISDHQLALVGQEKEAQVIANAKATIYEAYDQSFWDWYISGQPIASRALNHSADLYNPKALLSMQSPACVNVHADTPTTYEAWISFFNDQISQVQASGHLLSHKLVMLMDLALYRTMQMCTPSDASLSLVDRLGAMFGLEIIPEPKLMQTGKCLILDPKTTSVKLIVGHDPALLQLRSGVTDGWQKSGDSHNSEVYVSVTDAIMGNVLVLLPASMLAVQFQ